MHAGRPPLGMSLLGRLEGTSESRLRLWTIIETLAGKITIPEGCDRLGIHESRFHVMRREVLQAALDRLAPRLGGRRTVHEAESVVQLRAQAEDLRRQLVVARTEVEVAGARVSLRGRRRRRR